MPVDDPLSPAAWHVEPGDYFPSQARFAGGHVERDMLRAHAPAAPVFAAKARLITMGPGFARQIRERLAERGCGADNVLVPAGLNNSFALRSFLNRVFGGETGDEDYRHVRALTGEIEKWSGDRARLADAFDRADGFVMTLGQAEIWRDGATGNVFWGGVPEPVFERGRHALRRGTVAENKTNIAAILEMLRRHTGKPVVMSLSPVPLRASALGPSAIAADCASKSILRAALDETLPLYPEAHYWPAFEVVRWLGAHRDEPSFGEPDCRRVNRDLVELIADEFEAAFFED